MEIAEAHPENTIKRIREARRKHRAADRKEQQGSLPLRMFLSMDGDTARPECVHASNPFHKCADHCSRNNPAAARAERAKSADLAEKGNGNMDVDPKCVYASNPFHACADSCVRKRVGQDDGAKDGGQAITVKFTTQSDSDPDHRAVLGKVAKIGVYPMCPNASNPFHTCVESCLQRMARKDGVGAVVGMAKQGKEVMGDHGDGSMCCKNASNPFHDEYCVKRKLGREPVKRGETGSGFASVNASA